MIQYEKMSLGRAAMVLAMSTNREEEEKIKKIINKNGFMCAATEIGGFTRRDNVKNNLVNNTITAAFNEGVIEKTSNEVHAILHACIDAQKGVIQEYDYSVAFKIAVVRDDKWIGVAIFGKSAFHVVTNHERAGLGISHI